jgi:ABC-type protease/lipase transport system fused ATPase/permease subunit
MAYNSLIGDTGTLQSGGQKQRIRVGPCALPAASPAIDE